MLLEAPVRELGPVDYLPLKQAVEAVKAEAWFADQIRQQSFEQHRQTQSLVMLFSTAWPDPVIEKRSGWDYFAEPANTLIDSIIANNYPPGGRIIRAMAARLTAGGRIARHRDVHPSFAAAHRIHVPLVTNPDCDFVIRGLSHNLKEGQAYEVSNLDYHAVTNLGSDRTHFIFDYTLQ
ncbi:MAG: hypothetical protein B7Y90_08990 [Alphaproteobacteria bacterium 32-64-14]|nr:MAG: hypothetical protein B7Y90_08990 [Alphaproteobacteria bacterium 32-64-14]